MAFQWLQSRIQEEQERRERQANNLRRLPAALKELHGILAECIASYREHFGSDSADIALLPDRIEVTVREQREGNWHALSKVEVLCEAEPPGFQVTCDSSSVRVDVGLLPSDKLFYRDREQDQYLTMEELTRRILDRALFPAFREQ